MNEKNIYEEIKRLSALTRSLKDEITRLTLQVRSLTNEMKGEKNSG